MIISNRDAQRFFNEFMRNRQINIDFYERVPEGKFDFRLVDTNERKSDSIRESLAHQINVQRTYIKAVETGNLKFGPYYYKDLSLKTKKDLLLEALDADLRLEELLSHEINCRKLITVPWDSKKINSIVMLWSLNSHEILHTGWNLALMDALGIDRYDSLKQMWG